MFTFFTKFLESFKIKRYSFYDKFFSFLVGKLEPKVKKHKILLQLSIIFFNRTSKITVQVLFNPIIQCIIPLVFYYYYIKNGHFFFVAIR